MRSSLGVELRFLAQEGLSVVGRLGIDAEVDGLHVLVDLPLIEAPQRLLVRADLLEQGLEVGEPREDVGLGIEKSERNGS